MHLQPMYAPAKVVKEMVEKIVGMFKAFLRHKNKNLAQNRM